MAQIRDSNEFTHMSTHTGQRFSIIQPSVDRTNGFFARRHTLWEQRREQCVTVN